MGEDSALGAASKESQISVGRGHQSEDPPETHLPLQCPQCGHHLGLPQAREKMLPGVSAAMRGAMLQCFHWHSQLGLCLVTVAEISAHSGYKKWTTGQVCGTSSPCPSWLSPPRTHTATNLSLHPATKTSRYSAAMTQATHASHSDFEKDREDQGTDPQNPDGQSGH